MHSLISSGLRRFRLRECPRKLRATFLFNWMLAVEYWNQKVILLRILWTRSWSLNCHRSLRSNCSWKEALTRTTTTTTKKLLAWTGIEPIALHTAPPSELSNDLGTDHLNHNVVFRKRKLLAKETLTGDLSLLHLASRNHKEGILKCNTLRGTELAQWWWHSSSTNMPLLGFPDWLSNVDWVCWLLWLLEVFSL